MAENKIRIGADGIDAEAIVRKIRERADARRAAGEFDREELARAERYNLSTVKDDADFFDRYIACLKLISTVDINDFEIPRRRSPFAPLATALKKVVWKLLKFYTYRLWSQQNQTNNVLLAAIEIMDRRHRKETAELKARIAELEGKSS